MLFCNLQPRSDNIPVLFKHDLIPGLLVFLFTVSNGQIIPLSLRYAAEIGQSKADKASIGTIMGAYAALGRVLGSLSTYLVFLLIR